MAFLFLSHSSKDKDAWVRPLAKRLKAAGHTVFYDESEISTGASITTALAGAFQTLRERSDAFFVALLSSHSDVSPWVERECAVAEYLQATKRYPFVLPVLLPHAPVKRTRYLPFPDRAFFRGDSVSSIASELLSVVERARLADEAAVSAHTMPFMTTEERMHLVRQLTNDLLRAQECPSRAKEWILDTDSGRGLVRLEHSLQLDPAVLATLCRTIEMRSEQNGGNLVVFVSGFPGLGKTTLSKQLCYLLGSDRACLVHIESYLSDRSLRTPKKIQGNNPEMYDRQRIDRDLYTLAAERRSIQLPTKAIGDAMPVCVTVDPRPIVIVDGALDFIYDLHVRPDCVVFVDAPALVRLYLSLLRDMGQLPSDRSYSLSHAIEKWTNYEHEYYRATQYVKNRMHILLQADIHHRYHLLRSERR